MSDEDPILVIEIFCLCGCRASAHEQIECHYANNGDACSCSLTAHEVRLEYLVRSQDKTIKALDKQLSIAERDVKQLRSHLREINSKCSEYIRKIVVEALEWRP
jgi:hypothetical protein